MTRKEAAIRYALENGELDGLKVWLLNGGDIEEYFVKNKKNIKQISDILYINSKRIFGIYVCYISMEMIR